MMKHGRKLLWFVVFAVLIIAVARCDYDDRSKLTAPEQGNQEMTGGQNARHLINVYDARGVSNELFCAYVGNQEFVIQATGVFLLEYTTMQGTYYIVFEAPISSLLYVGLGTLTDETPDQIQTAILYPGRLIDTSKETQKLDYMTLFYWPDHPSILEWQEVFEKG